VDGWQKTALLHRDRIVDAFFAILYIFINKDNEKKKLYSKL
jgi:hypothetical protein